MLLRFVLVTSLIWPAVAFVPLQTALSLSNEHSSSRLSANSPPPPDRQRRQQQQYPLSSTPTEYLVKVQFEDFDDADTIAVRQGESLLSALERAASAQGWSEIPSDCRRGNCLTCTARHGRDSNVDHVQPLSEDGLSPALSINDVSGSGDDDHDDKNDDSDFFLTCRSTVTGPGVEVQVGQNSVVWKHLYKTRFEDESTRQASNVALARVLRKAAESHPAEWRAKTEALWNQQQQGGDDSSDAAEEGIVPLEP